MIEAAIWAMIIWFVLAWAGAWLIIVVSGILGVVLGEEFVHASAGFFIGWILGVLWWLFAMFHSISALINLISILAN